MAFYTKTDDGNLGV